MFSIHRKLLLALRFKLPKSLLRLPSPGKKIPPLPPIVKFLIPQPLLLFGKTLLTPSQSLKVTEFLVKVSQFKFLVVAGKNIFVL